MSKEIVPARSHGSDKIIKISGQSHHSHHQTVKYTKTDTKVSKETKDTKERHRSGVEVTNHYSRRAETVTKTHIEVKKDRHSSGAEVTKIIEMRLPPVTKITATLTSVIKGHLPSASKAVKPAAITYGAKVPKPATKKK